MLWLAEPHKYLLFSNSASHTTRALVNSFRASSATAQEIIFFADIFIHFFHYFQVNIVKALGSHFWHYFSYFLQFLLSIPPRRSGQGVHTKYFLFGRKYNTSRADDIYFRFIAFLFLLLHYIKALKYAPCLIYCCSWYKIRDSWSIINYFIYAYYADEYFEKCMIIMRYFPAFPLGSKALYRSAAISRFRHFRCTIVTMLSCDFARVIYHVISLLMLINSFIFQLSLAATNDI